MLSNEQRIRLETLVIEMILSIRSAYLHEVKGKPALDYWTRLENRMQAAARRCKSASHWATLFLEGMQLTNVDNSGSGAMTSLVEFCDTNDSHRALRTLIKEDHPFLIVSARKIVEARKQDKIDLLETTLKDEVAT